MRNKILLLLLLSSISAWAVRFPKIAKDNCQFIDSVAGTVTVVFATDSAHFALPVDSIQSVWISGSMTDLEDTIPGYRLDQLSEDSCFYKTFRSEELAKPGNSGQPEFVFYVIKADSTPCNIYGDNMRSGAIDKRLLFYNGIRYTLLILPEGPDYFTTDLDELYARGLEAKEIRPLADFDLTDTMDQLAISNFRLTPGTRHLYRSYHPFYPSNPQFDTEVARVFWVSEWANRIEVKSDISLTGDLSYTEGKKYVCAGDTHVVQIPSYLKTAMQSGNVCYVGAKLGKKPSVAQCYYHSDELLFAQWFAEVVQFINDENHPLPIQIHCAIGADRTGMVCALIAALCGASWQEIIADYQATGNMKIQTYRHPNRLRYGITKMTRLNPDSCSTEQLATAIRAHMVAKGVLTQVQMDQMVQRLTQPQPTDIPMNRVKTNDTWYDIWGNKVGADYVGIRIRKGEKRL